jgi:hypothetical protein
MSEAILSIMHSRKTRYDVLDEILGPRMRTIGAGKTVNIFVDIHSVYAPLFKSDLLPLVSQIEGNRWFLLSGELVNTAAHWRHYMWSRHRIYTNIFLYHSSLPRKDAEQIDPGYRARFYEKRILDDNHEWRPIRELVTKNIDIAKGLCEYIPYAYVVDGEETDHSALPLFYSMRMPAALNLVVSNDPVASLYPACRSEPWVTVTAKNEKSRLFDSENCLQNMSDAKSMPDNLPGRLAPWALAMAGCAKWDLPPIRRGMGVAKASKILANWHVRGMLATDAPMIDPQIVLDAAYNTEWTSDEMERMVINHSLLNPVVAYLNMSDEQFARLDAQLVDGYDPVSLKEVNQTYYSGNSISLDWLFDGVFQEE